MRDRDSSASSTLFSGPGEPYAPARILGVATAMKITRGKSPQSHVHYTICYYYPLLIVSFGGGGRRGARRKLVSFVATSFGMCMERAYPHVVSTGRKRKLVQKKEKNVLRAKGGGGLQACVEERQPADQMTLQIVDTTSYQPTYGLDNKCLVLLLSTHLRGGVWGGGFPNPRTQISPYRTWKRTNCRSVELGR